LISGPYAEAAAEVFAALSMMATVVGGDVGKASSIKMIRSVMMKGLETLFAEMVLSARIAGVEDDVLNSLDKTFPDFGFTTKAAYMFERVMTHGKRRAAEMREVEKTVQDLGLYGDMAGASVKWQQRIGDLNLNAGDDDGEYKSRADHILHALDKKTNGDKS
jgi:3-hydroxyisobutyrate dehydrogenase-like beta-hydroxyacid dehydrogenase